MRPFSSQKDIIRLAAVLEKHGDALSAIRHAQSELIAQFRSLELEWVNAHEKLKSISGRIAKRQALDSVGPPEPPADAGNGEIEADPYAGLDAVSRGILKRRNMGRP